MSLILIDGTALVYRAYFAFANRPLTAPSGEGTSIAFGFFNSVLGLIERFDPEKMAVVFDKRGKNFRHRMYPEYKANRKPMPEELAEQLPRLRELLDAWGIAVMEGDDVEADDVLATLARRSEGVSDEVWLYSGDKDFMQLLDQRTGMLKPGRRGEEVTPLTADDVRKQFQMEPAELIDVFALAGDKADNIPGAPGVGDKTAQKIIAQFGSLEGLFEQLESSDLTPRLKRILAENREQIYLSRDLFVIRRDVEMDPDWEAMATCLPDGPEVTALLEELGLRRVLTQVQKLSRTRGKVPDKPAKVKKTARAKPEPEAQSESSSVDSDWKARREEIGYELLDDTPSLKAWLEKLDPTSPLAVDTETDGLRSDLCRLVGVCLAGRDSKGRRLAAAYVPVLTREPESEEAAGGTLFPVGKEESRLEEVSAVLAPVLAANAPKIGQNLKFDEWVLDRHGLPLKGERFDTMLASYILDPERRSHGLDELVSEFLGHRMMPFSELFAPGDKQKDILGVDLDRLALYAAEDADYTLRLYEVLGPRLEEEGLEPLFRDLEMPVSAVLLRMEQNGIKIDLEFLKNLKVRFDKELVDLQKEIFELAGEDFNIQSPKQLSTILFDKLGLKPTKKTATGWSTDVSVLTALADEHELPAKILDYRQVAKLQNTYVETLPKLAHPDTGLIHTSYNQAVAATGRLSSSDPNLQNIPVRTELGREIRRAFVPRDKGNRFLSADYSQVELRLLAHLADDPALIQAFNEGADVHRRTAALIAGIPEDEVTPDMRYRAKAINFGVIYGMGARALARQIKVSVKEATAFIDTYFRTYPRVSEFIQDTRELARTQGWVGTLLGRRRLLPDILSNNNRTRAFQERIAVNTPIQGTAADLIKLAMIKIQSDLDGMDTGALLLLQVHDELVLEVPIGEIESIGAMVRTGMEGALELKVPLVVDIHVGDNWAEAHG